MPFEHAVAPPPGLPREGWWFLFHADRLLVRIHGDAAEIPLLADPADLGLRASDRQFLGTLDGRGCFAAELDEAAEPDGTAFRTLRSLLGILPEGMFALAGRAFQLLDWARSHRFCGKCGMPASPVPGERAMGCAPCGIQYYPRVSPAVIVAVVRDGRLLLAHTRRHPSVFFSVLAGFVEAGESFEECVRREIREEAGIEVKNIRYFGSQPWPFPRTMMVGFTAEYAGGDLVIEEKELVQAAWFEPEEVTRLQIPRHGTIARQLIDWFLAEHGRRGGGRE
ncbi:MAG: NAD(+) diphosphatase [Thermodesulfobacteriota bacterium]